MEIRGVYTALITPFLENGDVDYAGLRKNIEYQIKQGINGLLPLGTTGETPTLSRSEQDEIIKICVELAAGKIPVMVGTGSNSTEHTIENTKRAKELGADMVLIVTPYYNKPTQEGIYQHFKAVRDAVDIPIVVYNIAGRTGKNIETSTLKRIVSLGKVIGVKEASGNIGQMGDVIDQIAANNEEFNVMSGDDGITLPLISIGGVGVVSVVSNLVPKMVLDMVNAAVNGDYEEARELHYELLPLFKGAFIETNPIPIKAAMNMCGMAGGRYRLPMCQMEPGNKAILKIILQDMKLI